MLIDIITPIMLSLSPSLKEVPPISYDWKTQKSIIQLADGTVRPNDTGTTQGTRSFVGGVMVIDDSYTD
jgi:hypothetical protein